MHAKRLLDAMCESVQRIVTSPPASLGSGAGRDDLRSIVMLALHLCNFDEAATASALVDPTDVMVRGTAVPSPRKCCSAYPVPLVLCSFSVTSISLYELHNKHRVCQSVAKGWGGRKLELVGGQCVCLSCS